MIFLLIKYYEKYVICEKCLDKNCTKKQQYSAGYMCVRMCVCARPRACVKKFIYIYILQNVVSSNNLYIYTDPDKKISISVSKVNFSRRLEVKEDIYYQNCKTLKET